MPRVKNFGPAFDNIIRIPDDVQIGTRTSVKRGNWYLIKVGNQFPRLNLRTQDKQRAKAMAFRAYQACLEFFDKS